MAERAVKRGGGKVAARPLGAGLTFQRFFTKPDVHPFDEVHWERRSAVSLPPKTHPVSMLMVRLSHSGSGTGV